MRSTRADFSPINDFDIIALGFCFSCFFLLPRNINFTLLTFQDACGSQENTSGENQTAAKMTEHQVAKLMEEDMGSAMQYLQGKGLCLMPISLATTISTATCPSRNPLVSAVKEAGVLLSPNTATTPVVDVKGASVITVKDASSVSKP